MFQKEVALQPFNSFKVSCRAKYFQSVHTTYQLLEIVNSDLWKQEAYRILGGGYNTLFVTDYFDGIVLKMEMKGIKILSEDEHQCVVQVAAGESRADLIQWAQEHQLGGIENMVHIPGLVGSSAVSNIGAYGQEACEVIEAVMGVELETGNIKKLTHSECHFSYRNSVFKQELQDRFIITHVIYRLQKIDENYLFDTRYADIQDFFQDKHIDFDALSPREKLRTLTETIITIRSSKLPDPEKVGTAGSYFKNPKISLPEWEKLHAQFPTLKSWIEDDETVKLSAGQLIELIGRKGKAEGAVSISPKHALVLLNTGNSGQAIADLAEKIQDQVQETFGILLEPEVRYCYG